MKKEQTENTDFKLKIKMVGKESLTIDESDLVRGCWDSVVELERRNPQTLEEFGEYDLFDTLLQNYFTWKLVFTESGLDITNEMADIEEFILKYLKKFYLLMQMDELNRLPPAFQITD